MANPPPITPIAIDRFLVPDVVPSARAGLASVRQPLTRGVPFSFPLSGDLTLVVLVPTGVATVWRDADPSLVVTASSVELAPHQAPAGADPVALPPARLLLQQANATIAAIPLAVGLARIAPDGDGTPSIVELDVIAWAIHAGCMRGAGDFGSFIEIAWRSVTSGVDAFTLPPIDPHVAARQGGGIQSAVGIAGAPGAGPRGGYSP